MKVELALGAPEFDRVTGQLGLLQRLVKVIALGIWIVEALFWPASVIKAHLEPLTHLLKLAHWFLFWRFFKLKQRFTA